MSKFLIFASFLIFIYSCKQESIKFLSDKYSNSPTSETNLSEKQRMISDAALSIEDPSIIYDPTYFKIDYPNGDVPAGKGVCTDVVIRTYRKLGVDLQKEVHEDMQENFHLYPKIWGLSKPDKNIDHRRVPNLMVYFSRFGTEIPITKNAEDYLPGDIVSWRFSNGLTHIGIVVDEKTADGSRFKVVHNMGAGQLVEDMLFNFTIIGHHRFENF